MPQIELSAGTIDYEDSGGEGPVVVLLHGVLMDSTVWRKVTPLLPREARLILPTLPLGSHRRPMRAGADLATEGQVALVAELLEALDLHDVTLVGNDWGGAQLVVVLHGAERVRSLVLVACEAFDNYPPGLAGKILGMLARVPGGIGLAVAQMRIRALRRLPVTFGWMSKRPVPDEVMDAWLAPATASRAIRRDLRGFARVVPPRTQFVEWTERLRTFEGPALVVWATEDRLMPREHGRRLADLLPGGRLVEIADSGTLIPEDRPDALAAEISRFLAETARHQTLGAAG